MGNREMIFLLLRIFGLTPYVERMKKEEQVYE